MAVNTIIVLAKDNRIEANKSINNKDNTCIYLFIFLRKNII